MNEWMNEWMNEIQRIRVWGPLLSCGPELISMCCSHRWWWTGEWWGVPNPDWTLFVTCLQHALLSFGPSCWAGLRIWVWIGAFKIPRCSVWVFFENGPTWGLLSINQDLLTGFGWMVDPGPSSYPDWVVVQGLHLLGVLSMTKVAWKMFGSEGTYSRYSGLVSGWALCSSYMLSGWRKARGLFLIRGSFPRASRTQLRRGRFWLSPWWQPFQGWGVHVWFGLWGFSEFLLGREGLCGFGAREGLTPDVLPWWSVTLPTVWVDGWGRWRQVTLQSCWTFGLVEPGGVVEAYACTREVFWFLGRRLAEGDHVRNGRSCWVCIFQTCGTCTPWFAAALPVWREDYSRFLGAGMWEWRRYNMLKEQSFLLIVASPI